MRLVIVKNKSTADKLKREGFLKFKFEELKLRVEAYQKYINTVLQVNAFYYPVTGAVLGFYLNRPPNGQVVYILLLPIFMGAVLGGIFIYASGLEKNASKNIKEIIAEIGEKSSPNPGIKPISDVDLLRLLLLIFGFIFILVGFMIALMGILREYKGTFAPPHFSWFIILALVALALGVSATFIVNWVLKLQNEKVK